MDVRQMTKNPSKPKGDESDDGLWIAPRSSLKGENGERAWEKRITGPPNSSRFLELADIAMGLKKPVSKKTKKTSVHDTTKSEPYSH
jgi:hypothetical protein